ncbi:3140_t:CDS:2, partial [Gigaspora rosea]
SLPKEPSNEQHSTLDEDLLLLDEELSPIIDSKPASDEESFLLPEGSNKYAKIINCRAWINSNDNLNQCTHTFEIATSTTNLAGHLRTVHRLNQTGPLLPLSSEKEAVQLQPVRLDLSQPTLVELVNRIQELVELLGPFAHVTTIVGGNHYSTLSIMLPLVKILQEHLFQKEDTLTHPIICKVCDEIELSFGERWEEPGPEEYVAAMLDPRFKDISFELAKFESTKENLKCRMKEDIKNNYYSFPNTNLSTSLLSSLFEETISQ